MFTPSGKRYQVLDALLRETNQGKDVRLSVPVIVPPALFCIVLSATSVLSDAAHGVVAQLKLHKCCDHPKIPHIPHLQPTPKSLEKVQLTFTRSPCSEK